MIIGWHLSTWWQTINEAFFATQYTLTTVNVKLKMDPIVTVCQAQSNIVKSAHTHQKPTSNKINLKFRATITVVTYTKQESAIYGTEQWRAMYIMLSDIRALDKFQHLASNNKLRYCIQRKNIWITSCHFISVSSHHICTTWFKTMEKAGKFSNNLCSKNIWKEMYI